MDKRIKNQLISASYTKGILDPLKVQKIAATLTRKQLKQYIRILRDYENNTNVLIESPDQVTMADKKIFGNLFPGKRLEFETDPSIISGVRITDKDTIYEENLKNTLEELVDSLENSYD